MPVRSSRTHWDPDHDSDESNKINWWLATFLIEHITEHNTYKLMQKHDINHKVSRVLHAFVYFDLDQPQIELSQLKYQ